MKIEHIAINVADPTAVANWYAENMGLRIIRADTEGTRIHFLADEDGHTLLEFYANSMGDYLEAGPWTFHIAFNVSEIEPDCVRLTAAGCSPATDIITFDNGDQTQFLKDPFGLHIQLITRAVALKI